MLYPYDATPLSGYIGIKGDSEFTLEISIIGKDGLGNTFTYIFGDKGNEQTSYLVPVLGLYADYNNETLIRQIFTDGTILFDTFNIQTAALPDDFGIYEIIEPSSINLESNSLYFDSMAVFYLSGIDTYGEVRWYNSNRDVFGANYFEELNNGLLITQNKDLDQYIIFDYLGQIHDYFNVDFLISHDISVMDNGNILVTSDEPRQVGEPTSDYTIEDQISVFEYRTWDEIYNLDYTLLL